MKLCRVCRKEKPRGAFYPPPGRRVCKECYIKNVRRWIDRNPERFRENCNRTYRKDPSKRRALIDRWHKKHPEAAKARRVVSHAIKSGVLKKPDHCSLCRKEAKGHFLHAHHDDYTKPLIVNWVCAKCHRVGHEGTIVVDIPEGGKQGCHIRTAEDRENMSRRMKIYWARKKGQSGG